MSEFPPLMAKTTKTLNRLLEKRGIGNIKELSPEEGATFQKWKLILTGEITVDKIKEFCEAQIKVIEGKCDGVTSLSNIQQACIHVYINLLKVIDAQEKERESLERYLTQLVNS